MVGSPNSLGTRNLQLSQYVIHKRGAKYAIRTVVNIEIHLK